MPTLYAVCKRLYRGAVPLAVRHRLYESSPTSIKLLRKRLIGVLERTARHDEIYDQHYYDTLVEPTMQLSADVIADAIIAETRCATVLDVGCGTGLLMQALSRRGVRVTGLEYAEAALATCRARGLDVHKFDIERDEPSGDLRADVCVSTEVAEHLPERCAGRFVDLLCGMSATVVLTAATPNPRGTDHCNEQPNEYWITRFEDRGMSYDRLLTERWRREWNERGVAECFFSAVMVFRRPAVRAADGDGSKGP